MIVVFLFRRDSCSMNLAFYMYAIVLQEQRSESFHGQSAEHWDLVYGIEPPFSRITQ